jgi:hypothetical protein
MSDSDVIRLIVMDVADDLDRVGCAARTLAVENGADRGRGKKLFFMTGGSNSSSRRGSRDRFCTGYRI